jgi:hypothetical protein
MKVMKWLQEMIRFVSEAANRVFSPSDDEYPESGVQPYSGDVPSDR